MFALNLFWSWTSGPAVLDLALACIDDASGSATIFDASGSATISDDLPCP